LLDNNQTQQLAIVHRLQIVKAVVVLITIGILEFDLIIIVVTTIVPRLVAVDLVALVVVVMGVDELLQKFIKFKITLNKINEYRYF
jgi:hypothetical protein